ncbi:MAG: radical SAM protein [Candidatus Bathyarchaeota archaeon]|jgi:DNA repair photolyase
MLITKFDPWKSELCTCLDKLTFNPYTGCDHGCIYCYASSYIPRFFECRAKKDLIKRFEKESRKLKGEILSISNSSDPYPTIESELGSTRRCLEILSKRDCKVQIITKSDLVIRDIDILRRTTSMIAISLTTEDDNLSKQLEPNAPLSSARVKAVEVLAQKGIPVSVRIDPIIPFLNDDSDELVETLASSGAKHITSSTYKVKTDNWKRFRATFPEIAERLEPLYFERGERISGYRYLPRQMRLSLMKSVKELTEQNGMKFGTCREGLSQLNSATCDGSWFFAETC